MATARLALDYLRVLIWPFVVTGTVAYFRKEVRGTVARLTKLRLGSSLFALEAEAGVRAEAEVLVEAARELAPEEADSAAPPEPSLDARVVEELDGRSYHGEVIRHWARVSAEARATAGAAGLPWITRRSLKWILRALVDKQLLEPSAKQLGDQLHNVYQEVTSALSVFVSRATADRYEYAADRLITVLKAARQAAREKERS